MPESSVKTETSPRRYIPGEYRDIISEIQAYERGVIRGCGITFEGPLKIAWRSTEETITKQEIEECEGVYGMAAAVFLVGGSISSNVLSFCLSERISLGYVTRAVQLAEEHFRSLEEWHLGVEEDPETGDKWVALDVNVGSGVEEALKDYNSYLDSWAATPYPERSKIRLILNVL